MRQQPLQHLSYLIPGRDHRLALALRAQLGSLDDDGERVLCERVESILQVAKPEIFNTDQGSQFTSCAFTGILNEREIAIGLDGRGRAPDNIFVERLWRSVKYEDVYMRDYETAPQVTARLGRYFKFYNRERLHQALDYKTPEAVYRLTA